MSASLPSFLFYPSFSYPSIPSDLSIFSYLLFPNSSHSFLSISPFLGRLLPFQPHIFFPIPPLTQPPLFSTLSFFPIAPFLPIPLFHPTPPIRPTSSFPSIPSCHSIHSYPSFQSYPSFPSYPCVSSSPSFLHIPPLLFRHLPFLCLISFLPLLLFIPFFPTTPSLPTPPLFPNLYPFIHTPSFPCLPTSIRLPLLFATSAFTLTSPSLSLFHPHPLPSLSFLPHLTPLPPSPFHSLVIPSDFHPPPSFVLLHSLSPY